MIGKGGGVILDQLRGYNKNIYKKLYKNRRLLYMYIYQIFNNFQKF